MLLHNSIRGGVNRIVTPLVISANTSNYSLFTAAGSPTDAVDVLVTINAGVTVSSASTASYAFDTGVFPAGSNLTLTNNGIIVGRGGNGGNGNVNGPQTAGGAGGPALRAQSAISITNNNRIAGGGGGGGGSRETQFGSGGGGGGIGVSAGGIAFGMNGSAGTLTAAGGGGNPAGMTPHSMGWDAAGNGLSGTDCGGDGGGYGTAGGYGADGGAGFPGALGGAAGAAVVGNSNITWLTTGTRNGAIT